MHACLHTYTPAYMHAYSIRGLEASSLFTLTKGASSKGAGALTKGSGSTLGQTLSQTIGQSSSPKAAASPPPDPRAGQRSRSASAAPLYACHIELGGDESPSLVCMSTSAQAGTPRLALGSVVALHARRRSGGDCAELRLLQPERTLILLPEKSTWSLSEWHTLLCQQLPPASRLLATLPAALGTTVHQGWLSKRPSTDITTVVDTPLWRPLYCRLLAGGRLEMHTPSEDAGANGGGGGGTPPPFELSFRTSTAMPTSLDVGDLREWYPPSGGTARPCVLGCCAPAGCEQASPTCFQLAATDRRVYVLDANDEDNLKAWLAALSYELAHRQAHSGQAGADPLLPRGRFGGVVEGI